MRIVFLLRLKASLVNLIGKLPRKHSYADIRDRYHKVTPAARLEGNAEFELKRMVWLNESNTTMSREQLIESRVSRFQYQVFKIGSKRTKILEFILNTACHE